MFHSGEKPVSRVCGQTFYSACLLLSFAVYVNSFPESRTEMTTTMKTENMYI